MADIIDINVSQTTETITINSTPNLTTVNINTISGGGGAVTSVNGDIGDVIVPTSDNNFTNALKTKLDGISTGAEVNVNADWNATSGDAQILNKPSIPAAQVNSDWNSVSGVSQILNKPTIPTQTSQLTNNGADGTNPFITALDIPTAGQAGTLVREVKNMTGATLTKGTVVYISGANGNKPLVSKALATTDALSARTFGLLQSNISNNGVGYCIIIGDLTGLDTSAFTEGVQLYLSGVTAGTYTSTKTLAPTHLVYVGKVTRSHPTLGQIEVGIQNGYELEEIHDVAITSVADKQLLSYDLATDLWKNKSVTTADISDSTNKRYVTDANLTTIGNQSGTNTGDQDLSNLVVKNTAITGATKTKITYDAKGLVTAGADATTADIADSTNKRYQTDNQNTYNDATSSIQTQLNAKQNTLGYTPYRYINTTSSTVTGTTAETIMATATISANTFNANDVMKILYEVSKSATIVASTLRIKINTSNTLTGATTIATYTFALANAYALIQRSFIISSGNLVGIAFNTSVLTDVAAVTTASSSTTYNPANTLYLFFTLQLGNTADSTTFTMGNITN
jgi:hypothetical protein